MAFQKAQRKKAKLRLALCGPSGSGKTYSALLIAQGLAPNGRIALIDTERGSGELYSDLVDYDVDQLSPPFTPKRYIELIQEAEQAGYDVLIIDSLSHAWSGEGGILDLHDKAVAASRSGNSFTAWREVTPQHNALVEKVLGANLHVITTMRTKTAYDMVDDGNGKKRPIKIGLAPVQRDGMEYEFTVVMDLSIDGHVATAMKDRTRLFDGQHFIPTPETGAMLKEWLEVGKDPGEESRKLLADLKARVDQITAVPHLNNWWRAHNTEIESLSAPDRETLQSYCAERKAIILKALEDGKKRETGKEEESAAPATRTSKGQGKLSKWNRGKLEARILKLGLDRERVRTWANQKWGVQDLSEITLEQFQELDGQLEQLAKTAWEEIKDQRINEDQTKELAEFINSHGLEMNTVKSWAGINALYEITNAQLDAVWDYLHKLARRKAQEEWDALSDEEKARRNQAMESAYMRSEEAAGRSATAGT
jgi:hypothetical protein